MRFHTASKTKKKLELSASQFPYKIIKKYLTICRINKCCFYNDENAIQFWSSSSILWNGLFPFLHYRRARCSLSEFYHVIFRRSARAVFPARRRDSTSIYRRHVHGRAGLRRPVNRVALDSLCFGIITTKFVQRPDTCQPADRLTYSCFLYRSCDKIIRNARWIRAYNFAISYTRALYKNCIPGRTGVGISSLLVVR